VIVPVATTVAEKSSCFSPPAKTVIWRTSPRTTGDADVSACATRKSSADAIIASGTNLFIPDMSLFLAPRRFENPKQVPPSASAAGFIAPPA
jgi:hypothetical protein